MSKEELWTLKQNGKISSGLPMWADFHRSANKRICSCCHYSKSRCFVEAIFGFDFRLIFALIAFFSLEDAICKSVANIRGHILASNFWIQFSGYFCPDFVLPVRGPGAGGGENQQKGPAANHGRWSDRTNVTISVIKMKNHHHHHPMRVPFLASVKLSLAPPAPSQHLKPILFLLIFCVF